MRATCVSKNKIENWKIDCDWKKNQCYCHFLWLTYKARDSICKSHSCAVFYQHLQPLKRGFKCKISTSMSVEIFACFLSASTAIRGSCGANIQVMYLHIRTPNFRTSTLLLLPAVSAPCFILIYALRQSRLLLAHFLHKNARILLLIAIMRTSCVSRCFFALSCERNIDKFYVCA